MPNTDFAQTVLEQFSDISTMVSQYEIVTDRWGEEVPRFYTVDIQDNEVIVVDRNNNYNYFGFQFTMNGDKAEIDFTNGNRKKLRYENYEDGISELDGSFNFGEHIANIENVAFAKIEDVNVKIEAAEFAKSEIETNYNQLIADYDEFKMKHDEIKVKYDEYVQAEEARQVAELNAQKDAKFAEYEDVLSENADFMALKDRKDEMSVDEIEKECAVMYVKANRTKSNFNKSSSTSAVVGVMNDGDIESDGYIKTKYGNIPVNR